MHEHQNVPIDRIMEAVNDYIAEYNWTEPNYEFKYNEFKEICSDLFDGVLFVKCPSHGVSGEDHTSQYTVRSKSGEFQVDISWTNASSNAKTGQLRILNTKSKQVTKEINNSLAEAYILHCLLMRCANYYTDKEKKKISQGNYLWVDYCNHDNHPVGTKCP